MKDKIMFQSIPQIDLSTVEKLVEAGHCQRWQQGDYQTVFDEFSDT